VLGGLASARTPEGSAALFLGEEVVEAGAVGVNFDGIELVPCVSQGAAPIGRELTITGCQENIITELAGKPALETIEDVIGELGPRERTLIAAGLLIGIVIDPGRPEYEQGDFLVRGVLGADRDSGAVAVGAPVRPGQIVRLHARDARSADLDLRRALALRMTALSGRPPAGALVFSCNGRGRQMFGVRHHDALAVQDDLGGIPAAGFFAAGEIGPVGGRSFLHGFTATVAVFPRTRS
jgi:small ligand-binding sensory domain FIST